MEPYNNIKRYSTKLRVARLRYNIENLLNYYYFNTFIPLISINKFEDIPENEQQIGIFGKQIRKIIGQYTFDEYMENKIINYPYKRGDKLIEDIIIKYRNMGYAYQLFPDDLLSYEYIEEIDIKIINIANKIDELTNSNDLSYVDYEDQYLEYMLSIELILFDNFYLNKIKEKCDFDNIYDTLIKPDIHKIYRIKELYD